MINKSHLVSILTVVPILIALAACGTQKTEWKGTFEKENGVMIVKNPKEPMYGEDVLSFEEELTIGKSREGEEPAFLGVSGIQVDSQGNIFISDGEARQVKVFDKDGHLIRSFGRKGQGPGEFQVIHDIVLTPDETIMILDRGNLRLSFFSPEGKLLKDVSLSRIPDVFRIYPDSEGNYTARFRFRRPNTIYQIKKLDENLEELSLVAELEHPRRSGVIEIYDPQLRVVIMNNGNIVWGNWHQYKLMISDRTGKKVREIRKEYDPVKITDEDREKMTKELFANLPLRSKVEFPDYYPAFQGLSCDEQGRIFVRTSEYTGNDQGYYYDVFDEEGRYMAKILLPFSPRTWKNNTLYTVEEDEEGFQIVKRYKVSWKH